MNYGQCQEYLQKILESGVKFGLENVSVVLAELGNPHRSYPTVLVAGTNGKGSVCAMLAEILTFHGLRVGLYTSPHLVRVEERIRVGEDFISPGDFCRLLTRLKKTIEALISAAKLAAPPTYFETLTCLAFLYFREKRVDAAVLEVGMGGRLDATNVVTPDAAIITSVSRDHQEYLGRTLGRIAFEKAGIIKPGVPVICGLAGGVALDVIKRKARQDGARFIEVFKNPTALAVKRTRTGVRFSFCWGGEVFQYSPRLAGVHQGRNAAVAIVAALELRRRWSTLAKRTILRGVAAARWEGRLEILGRWPLLVLDGAHNEAGARAVRDYALDFLPRPLTLVFAVMKDKDIPRLTRLLFPLAQTVILTSIPSPRAAPPESIILSGCPEGIKILVEPVPLDAVRLARELTPRGGSVLVTGSLFLVGEVKKRIAFLG